MCGGALYCGEARRFERQDDPQSGGGGEREGAPQSEGVRRMAGAATLRRSRRRQIPNGVWR